MTQQNHNQKTGCWGEGIAAEFLCAKGYRLVQRNFRTQNGELDLVMENDDMLVFVEVKTRTGLDFGYPEESVTETKREHFLAAVEEYLESCPENAKDWRVDVIAITGNQRSSVKPHIKWFEDAFS